MHAISRIAAILMLVPAAAAQSFNINIGPAGGPTPSPTYAAAGQPGVWITIPTFHNTTTFNLVDRTGTTTGVSVWQYGGTQLRSTDDPATSGDDDALIDECQVTFTPTLETCLFFNNLQNGEYEVLIYACMPAQPTVLSYTSCDEEPGRPHYSVGGAWPGSHQEFVTYSRHVATVTTGLLRTHSGIVPGQPAANGAAFNGIQLRRIVPGTPGDTDGDGDVDLNDLTTLLSAFGSCEGDAAYVAACDLNDTDCIELGDLTILLANFGL